MCGITGLIAKRGRDDVGARVEAMTMALRHRGPDDGGVVIRTYDPFAVGLGHRRLSIIDLSPAGHQPMQSPTGRDVWIVFNGEIYNFQELRPELENRGFKFTSSSDTEVILAAYEAWGGEFVSRLAGMFAL